MKLDADLIFYYCHPSKIDLDEKKVFHFNRTMNFMIPSKDPFFLFRAINSERRTSNLR